MWWLNKARRRKVNLPCIWTRNYLFIVVRTNKPATNAIASYRTDIALYFLTFAPFTSANELSVIVKMYLFTLTLSFEYIQSVHVWQTIIDILIKLRTDALCFCWDSMYCNGKITPVPVYSVPRMSSVKLVSNSLFLKEYKLVYSFFICLFDKT